MNESEAPIVKAAREFCTHRLKIFHPEDLGKLLGDDDFKEYAKKRLPEIAKERKG